MPISQLPPIPKVSVFVIDDNDRLLVFEHSDFPSAGIQVPAGTIERDEQPLTAALRELCEETGKQSFEITRFVARKHMHEVRLGCEELHDRWFFQASPTQRLPEEWVFGDSTLEGWIRFDFYWISRPTAESSLTPDHAEVYRLTSAEHDRK
jgi:8-oxo-dGTP pyrophosphatase MutT (NUDIX family)